MLTRHTKALLSPSIKSLNNPLIRLRSSRLYESSTTSKSNINTTNNNNNNNEDEEQPDRPFTLPTGEYRPKQSLGQNFLSDQNYVMKIVNAFKCESESSGGSGVIGTCVCVVLMCRIDVLYVCIYMI